jgi:hypothetical protein
VLASSGEVNTLNEGLLDLLQAARTMISSKSGHHFVTTILQVLSNLTLLQFGHYGHFTDTTHQTCLRLRPSLVHLRPPPPLLADPRALADLDCQPPPLLPLKADDPLPFS